MTPPFDRLGPEIDLAALPEATQAAARALAATPMFALGGVGFAGTTSDGEAVARALLGHAGAAEAFEWVARQASGAGRVYAYWALRALAPDRARVVREVLAHDSLELEHGAGCNISRRTVGDLVQDIANRALTP